MLITNGKASLGDYGEQSLVSKFLLAMVLNEYSSVNLENGECFKRFASDFLDISIDSPDFSAITSTTEFQCDRCGTGGDKTRFDALLTFEDEWIWGIEAKYFDVLKTEQINREYRSIKELKEKLQYKHAGLLFITPEELLGSIVYENEVSNCLKNLRSNNDVDVRLGSWEMIFDILAQTGTPKLKEEIGNYIKLRNNNKSYALKLYTTPQTKNSNEWLKILKNKPSNVNLRRLSEDYESNFGKFGKASSDLATLFQNQPESLELAEKIIKISNFDCKAQKSGYANLAYNKRAYAQIHPHNNGIAFVIRESYNDQTKFSDFEELPLNTLSGYKGTNKLWLEGKRSSKSAAKAFYLPNDLLNENEKSQHWLNVKSLINYAKTR